MKQLSQLTKEVEKERAHLLYTWNPGMQILNNSLELRKNTGAEEFRARDLFYALWVPDLFMKRVEEDDRLDLNE